MPAAVTRRRHQLPQQVCWLCAGWFGLLDMLSAIAVADADAVQAEPDGAARVDPAVRESYRHGAAAATTWR